MATSRHNGGSFSDDDHNDSDAVIIQQTATTSNSSRRIAAFGLLTPLASPDSQLKLYPSDFQFTSAPHAPPPLRDIPKDIKPLTFAPKHSEHSFDFRCIPAPHAPPSLRDIPKDTKSLTFAPKPSECSFDFRCIPAPHAPPPFRDIPKDTEPLTFAPKLSERSFDFRCIPAPHAPPPLRDIPKDTKPLTFASKPSEDSKKESAPTLPPLTGLLTLDSTPPRNLRLITGLPTPDTPPRSPRPICPEVKSESSPSPDTTSNVALAELSRSPCQKQCTKLLQNELAVTTEHEYVLCAGRREQQCSGITSGSEKQCQISVYHPNRYCRHHVDQDTGSKSYEQSIEGSSITSPHPAGLPTPDSTPPPDSKVVCWETGVKSESSPSPEAISSVAEIAKTSSQTADVLHNTLTVITKFEEVPRTGKWEFQCSGITTKKRQCRISVYRPDRYCGYHLGQDTGPKPAKRSNDASTAGIHLPHPAGDQHEDISRTARWELQCGGITKKKKRQCRISVYYPDRYCNYHEDQDTGSKLSEQSGKGSTHGIVSLYPARLTTPDSTPPLDSRLICWETKVKSESSPSPETTSRVAEIAETSWKASKLLRNKLTLIIEDTGLSVSTSSANEKGPRRQSTGTAEDPTTEPNVQCRDSRCKRAVKPPARYCNWHISESPSIPFTPFISTTPPERASTIYYSSNSVGIVRRMNKDGFTVHRWGPGFESVRFDDHNYIPQYLQQDTQRKLRDAIEKGLTEKDTMPGYVYALNVTDPEHEGKLAFKVGYSKNVTDRYSRWKNICKYITGIRGWWPRSINAPNDYDESLVEKLITSNQQGDAGPMAGQLERLVHIELTDLATHAPYLHPSFPNITYRDVPPQEMAKPKRKHCGSCGQKHQEIFSFRRVEEGDLVGKEWEVIVKPVIRKWGEFLKDHFAEEI